jgi:hypothetical protein
MNPALAHALALLASLGAAVVLFLAASVIAAIVMGVSGSRSVSNSPSVSTEPDPIESYPAAPSCRVAGCRAPLAPSITIVPALPVIVNPLTNTREPSSEIVS